MSIEIEEIATIYSPFESSRMKVIKLGKDSAYITIADADSTAAMKLNRRKLVELYKVIGGLLEVER